MTENKALYRVFVIGFLLLYACVALISFFHAIEFFSIGNVKWMSTTLAGAFELGLALSLASILLSDENKKTVLPWILTTILTLVQVIGNVYSVYKFIAESGTDYYKYLANPTLFWIEDISQETVMIIISWIMGAILPVIALFMTDMVASNIKHMKRLEREAKEREGRQIIIPGESELHDSGIAAQENGYTGIKQDGDAQTEVDGPEVSDEEQAAAGNSSGEGDTSLIKEDPVINPSRVDDMSTQIKQAFETARVTRVPTVSDDAIKDYPS